MHHMFHTKHSPSKATDIVDINRVKPRPHTVPRMTCDWARIPEYVRVIFAITFGKADSLFIRQVVQDGDVLSGQLQPSEPLSQNKLSTHTHECDPRLCYCRSSTFKRLRDGVCCIPVGGRSDVVRRYALGEEEESEGWGLMACSRVLSSLVGAL